MTPCGCHDPGVFGHQQPCEHWESHPARDPAFKSYPEVAASIRHLAEAVGRLNYYSRPRLRGFPPSP